MNQEKEQTMSQNILKSNEIDTSKITFSTVKTNKFGGKLVYLNYNRGPLRVQTPKMSLPFGVSRWEDKFSMELSFGDMAENQRSKQFYDSVKAVEAKVKAEAGSKNWFKKKLSAEVLENFFKSQLKHSLDEEGNDSGKYPPRIKTKLVNNDDGFRADFYDSVKNDEGEYEKMPVDSENIEETISKGSKAIAIIECTGVWLMDTSFGISWKVVQAKVFKNTNKISGFCLRDDDEEKDNEEAVEEVTEELSDVAIEDEETDVKVVDLPKKKSMKKTSSA